MVKFIVLLVLVILLSGCASFGVARYNDQVNYPPTNPNLVKIFNSEPPQPFEKIGELTCNAAPASSFNSINKRFQMEAAKMGADAVIVNTNLITGGVYHNMNSYGSGFSGSATPMYKKSILGIAIKFKEDKSIAK